MARSEWYAEGLRFECTLCGNCCSGPPGYVLVTDEEARAIAARLGLSVAAFLREYTRQTPQGRSLTERQTEAGMDCVFLDRATMPGKAVCSLYEQRPLQCRTFPWWPENLRDRRGWERLGRVCEGVNRGPTVSIVEIRVQRDAQKAATGDGGPSR